MMVGDVVTFSKLAFDNFIPGSKWVHKCKTKRGVVVSVTNKNTYGVVWDGYSKKSIYYYGPKYLSFFDKSSTTSNCLVAFIKQKENNKVFQVYLTKDESSIVCNLISQLHGGSIKCFDKEVDCFSIGE